MRAAAKINVVVFLFVVSFAVSAFGSAAKIYITQTGSATGNCTTSVQTPAFFNNAANWGAGANQIGPGTTVLFCGTFTGTAGQTGFTFQGSGTSGSPITLLFDTNAQMSAPYWGSGSSGAIFCTGRSYLIVNGGTNGIIQNTANGTSLAYSQSSYGIFAANCSNIEIRNITIQNIYLNQGSSSSATDTNGQNTGDIYLQGTSTGDNVHDNVLNNARTGLWVDFDSGHDASNLAVYNNTISDHPWGVTVGACNASSTATGVAIYNNDFSDWLNWQFPISTYHTDGIIVFNDADGGYTCAGLGALDTFRIFNNYFHGSLGGGSPTGYIACGERTACTIFNNLMVDNGSLPCDGYIWAYATGGPFYIYNNTIVGGSGANQAITLNASLGTSVYSKATIENNISTNVRYAIGDYNPASLSIDLTASDYNIWLTNSGGAPQSSYNYGGSPTFYTFASLQNLGFDTHSLTSDPKLNSAYHLQSGSPAIGLGANLTSLSITALGTDKAGASRSSSGAWDAGVYTYLAPTTPTGLNGTVGTVAK
jgi:hypothetical protein